MTITFFRSLCPPYYYLNNNRPFNLFDTLPQTKYQFFPVWSV